LITATQYKNLLVKTENKIQIKGLHIFGDANIFGVSKYK